MGAQLVHGLIRRKARRIGRNLKQHAARFVKIDGVKILAVGHRRNVKTRFGEFQLPGQLRFLAFRTERHVMNRTRAQRSLAPVRPDQKVDRISRRSGIAGPVPLTRRQFIAEDFRQQLRRRFVPGFRGRAGPPVGYAF